MKAIVCRQFGPPESLSFEELPDPSPGPGEVVVSVKAASVNFPDVLLIQNKYQVKPTLPFSPGAELSGTVKSTGKGVTNVKPGDPVIGFAAYGAFAEQCIVPAGAAGGVGLAAVEIGKILGLRVIACASSAEKLAICREHGADETIDYVREDLRGRIKDLTGGKGVDVIYDPVGGPSTEAALRSSAWRARLLVIGFAGGDIPKLPLNLPLLMERSIVGVYWGEWSRRNPGEFAAAVRELSAWYAEERLKPHVSETFPLARAAEALALMAARQVKGKVVITVDG